MNTVETNDTKKSSVEKSNISLDMSNGYPLQIIADPRFHRLIVRGMRGARVAPISSKEMTPSECSSWSSASAVSTIDLKSPEPISQKELTEKLATGNNQSRNRNLLNGFIIFAIILIFIGIILSIVLPLILNKNPSVNNGMNTSSSVNQN